MILSKPFQYMTPINTGVLRKWCVLLIMVLIIGAQVDARANSKTVEQNYGKTPDEYVPYKKFSNPYKKFFLEPNEYLGYGRNIPEPDHIDTIDIGFLGPIEKTVSVATGGASHEEDLGKKMLLGARLAIEHANEHKGYRGKGIPFRLVVRNDNGLWGASANEIIDLAYNERVWAILGTIDGANSHIAIRTALKAELVVMNSGNTDPTYTETAIPWAFRCITDDRQMCYLLADYVFKKLGLSRVAALRANNRYGRISIDEFRDAATRIGKPFITELNYRVGDTDFSRQLERIKALKPDAVMTYGDARESALILKQIRAMGLDVWFIGSDRIVSDEFIENVDGSLEKVIAGHPYNPLSRDEKAVAFKTAFEEKFGESAETFAAHAYDGMNMIIDAIEKGGLNRAKIRDELAAMTTYHGVSGLKQFDPIFNNISNTYLAIGNGNQFEFLTRDQAFK